MSSNKGDRLLARDASLTVRRHPAAWIDAVAPGRGPRPRSLPATPAAGGRRHSL